MEETKKIYFASDFHLGYPDNESSLPREKRLVGWLDSIKCDAGELYLLGDVFDFWFEYKWVVPRGYVRFLGKLAEMVDSGVKVFVAPGNHDLWHRDYLEKEIGVVMVEQPLVKEWGGKRFYLHHGHALGSYDKGMLLLNAVFSSKMLQFLFARIHPNGAFAFAHRWSNHNRKAKVYESDNYLGDDNEFLLKHSKDVLKHEHFDYFIYGHRHLSLDMEIEPGVHYVNLGNWITRSTYGVWDGEEFRLREY